MRRVATETRLELHSGSVDEIMGYLDELIDLEHIVNLPHELCRLNFQGSNSRFAAKQ